MAKPEADKQSTRIKVYECVCKYPGIHVRGISRTLDIEVALVQYHLHALAEDKLVEFHEQGGYSRYYPTRKGKTPTVDPADVPLLGLLREEAPLHIVLTLLDQGPLTHREIADATKIAKSTLSYHLAKLAKEGIVERFPSSTRVRLAERGRIIRLLTAYKPTPEMRSAFEDLWGDLYE
jgi:predicted transcriptional regulator